MRDYWYCPDCKGNFDHGEPCDCVPNEKEAAPQPRIQPRTKTTTVSVSASMQGVKTERRTACG